MPYVKVRLPDGEKCGHCKFHGSGTVVCKLFDEFLEETDDYTNMKKCKSCLLNNTEEKEGIKMEQKLMAFWKYDLFPFIVCGEVESFTDCGNVRIKNYNGAVVTPVKILPYEVGEKIQQMLIEYKEEYEKTAKQLLKEYTNKADLNNIIARI